MKKTLTDILDKHPKAKLVILLGGEAWSSFLHLEDEKYKQLPVFCAMASRNGIRIPEDSIDMRNYNPVSINLTERMKEYNVKYCDTYEYNISKDIEMIQDFYPDTWYLYRIIPITDLPNWHGSRKTCNISRSYPSPILTAASTHSIWLPINCAIFPETQQCFLVSGELTAGESLT